MIKVLIKDEATKFCCCWRGSVSCILVKTILTYAYKKYSGGHESFVNRFKYAGTGNVYGKAGGKGLIYPAFWACY